MTKVHYYSKGPVRGCCGHRHRTPETAIACSERDGYYCHRQGGYSDRQVYGSDGTGPYWFEDEDVVVTPEDLRGA